jgi:hypothetical protein
MWILSIPACGYACMYVCIYVCMRVNMYMCMFTLQSCMYACASVHVQILGFALSFDIRAMLYMHILDMHEFVCAYAYVGVSIHTCTHACTYTMPVEDTTPDTLMLELRYTPSMVVSSCHAFARPFIWRIPHTNCIDRVVGQKLGNMPNTHVCIWFAGVSLGIVVACSD